MNRQIEEFKIETLEWNQADQVWEVNAEKFAQLIIKQCAKISNQAEKQCQHPGTAILKHFGVEQ
jgi:hypothetical protein